MSHAKRVQRTTGKVQNIKSLSRTDKTVRQKNHGSTMLKMSSMSDLKRRMAPKILNSLNSIMSLPAKLSMKYQPCIIVVFFLFVFFSVQASLFSSLKIILYKKIEKHHRDNNKP